MPKDTLVNEQIQPEVQALAIGS